MEKQINSIPDIRTRITLQNHKLLFKGEANDRDPVLIDSKPPLGDGQGYNALELLLISLSSCIGSIILNLLRKMRKDVITYTISAEGVLNEDKRDGFKMILLHIRLSSVNTSREDVFRAIELAEGYCPVGAMLNKEIPVRYEVYIES